MPTIQGFKMKNGEIDANTIKKMIDAGAKMPFEAINLQATENADSISLVSTDAEKVVKIAIKEEPVAFEEIEEKEKKSKKKKRK